MKFADIHIHHIRYKLLISYWLVIVAILTSYSISIFYSIKQSILDTTNDSLSMQMDLIKTSIETSYEASIKGFYRATAYASLDAVKSCYEKYRTGELSADQAQDLAWSLLKGTGLGPSGYIAILNSKGILVYHPFEEYLGNDVSGTQLSQAIIEGNETFIEYDWLNPGDETPREKLLYSLYFEPWDWYISVTGYKDELMELVSLSDFEDKILSIRFGDTGYPIVVDMEGTLLIHPAYKGINMMDREDSMGEILRKSLELRNGQSEYYWKNPGEKSYRKKLTFFAEIPQFRILVAVTIYESEILEPLENIKKIFYLVSILSFLATGFVTVYISKSITKPIMELKKKMNSAASGDLSIRSQILSRDEVGEIGHYFNALISALQQNRTELNQTQKKLIQEERFSNVGRLLARISHHLNTPLGNAVMTGSYMEEELDKCEALLENGNPDSSDLIENFRRISEASVLMKHSIDKSVDIVRNFKLLQYNTSERAPVKSDMKEFLEVHFRSPWLNLLEKDFTISIVCPEGVELRTDYSLLRLVLDKLASNSQVHGFKNRENGEIRLQVKPEGEGIRLIYSDNGDGIPADMADRVFEPFFSLDENFQNTGLGLNILYTVVTTPLEGTIQYTGDISGCRYSLYLPDLKG